MLIFICSVCSDLLNLTIPTGAAEASGKSFVEKYPNGPKSCDRRSDKRFLAKKVVNFGVAKAVKDVVVLPKKK
jgi:hypothetical protein